MPDIYHGLKFETNIFAHARIRLHKMILCSSIAGTNFKSSEISVVTSSSIPDLPVKLSKSNP